MKKFIFGLLATFALLIGATSLTSCGHRHGLKRPNRDSVFVENIIAQHTNPVMYSVDDLYGYVSDIQQHERFVFLVSNLHERTVAAIGSKAMDDDGYITEGNFVKTYEANSSTYDATDRANRQADAKHIHIDEEEDTLCKQQ